MLTPRKPGLALCFLSVLLLSGASQALAQVEFFRDDFNGTAIDPSRWNTTIATSGVRWCDEVAFTPNGVWTDPTTTGCRGALATANYGSVAVAAGWATFSESGAFRTFPYVWAGPPSRPSPFPAGGDFSLRIVMRFQAFAPHGDGIWVACSQDTDPIGNHCPFAPLLFQVWAGAEGIRVGFVGGSYYVSNPYASHTYDLIRSAGAYSLRIDNVSVGGPVASQLYPTSIGLGNPVMTWWGQSTWCSFSVDQVSVSIGAAAVDVLVTSTDDQQPLAGAEVTLRQGGFPIATAETNAAGHALLAGGQPGAAGIYCQLGAATAANTITLGAATVTRAQLQLPPGHVVRMKVVDSFNGQPIKGARVYAQRDGSTIQTGAWSNETGDAVLGLYETGAYTVTAGLDRVFGSATALQHVYTQDAPLPFTIEESDGVRDLGEVPLRSRVVLLLHGIKGSSSTWRANEWPAALSGAGFSVLDDFDFPGSVLSLDWHGMDPIEDQVRALETRIAQLGLRSCAVIAHSQGGLVARYLNDVKWSKRPPFISRLVCLGTPQHGSPIFNSAQGLALLVGGAVGSVNPPAGLNIAASGLAIVGALKATYPAIRDLCPNSEFLTTLNQAGRAGADWSGDCSRTPPPEVGLRWEHPPYQYTEYLNVAGTAPFGSGWMAVGALILGAGGRCFATDGAVPTVSAHLYATEPQEPHPPYPNVHNIQRSVHHKRDGTGLFDDTALRAEVVQYLVAGVLPSSVTSGGEGDAAKADESWERMLSTDPLLAAGGEATAYLPVDRCDALRVSWEWFLDSVDAVLFSPSGRRIDPTSPAGDPGITYFVDPETRFGSYVIEYPETGLWRVSLGGTGAAEQRLLVWADGTNTARLETSTRPSPSKSAGNVVVDARLTRGELPEAGTTVTVTATGPSGAATTYQLHDDGAAPDSLAGDGLFSGELPLEATAGTTAFDFYATGGALADVHRHQQHFLDTGLGADLAIVDGSFTAVSSTGLSADDVRLVARVVNRGPQPVTAEVTFALSRADTILSRQQVILSPGQSVEVEASHFPLVAGTYGYLVSVEPLAPVAEQNWFDNAALAELTLAEGPTDVPGGDDPGEPDLPPEPGRVWRLAALPNPFNPQVVLRIEGPRDVAGALRIYNPRGQLVRELWRGALVDGLASCAWDGRDDAGRRMPGGIYLATLSGDGFRETIKISLVK